MRRILLMLPVLALVACQGDVPTEIDEPPSLARNPSDTKPSFRNVGFSAGYEHWYFYVPSETRQPIAATLSVKWNDTWKVVDPAWFWANPSDDLTGDGIPDLFLLFAWPYWPNEGPCSVRPFAYNDLDGARVELTLWFDQAVYQGTTRIQNVDCPLIPPG
jgi:hypothetical protein